MIKCDRNAKHLENFALCPDCISVRLCNTQAHTRIQVGERDWVLKKRLFPYLLKSIYIHEVMKNTKQAISFKINIISSYKSIEKPTLLVLLYFLISNN